MFDGYCPVVIVEPIIDIMSTKLDGPGSPVGAGELGRRVERPAPARFPGHRLMAWVTGGVGPQRRRLSRTVTPGAWLSGRRRRTWAWRSPTLLEN